MRILVLSDLHLEFWRGHHPAINPAISKPDVVVLAGDIHSGTRAVTWASDAFKGIPVLYVHGNHEAYGYNLEDIQRDIKTACDYTDNVFFLNQEEIIVDGVRFLGCTLWTDFFLFDEQKEEEAMKHANAFITDYRRIEIGKEYKKLTPSDTQNICDEHCIWLGGKLLNKFDGKTVVITHMAPSFLSVADRFKNDILSACFASNFDDFCALSDFWIHGHTHDSFDYQIGKCRVVCNPLGYPTLGGGAENPNFNPNFILEV